MVIVLQSEDVFPLAEVVDDPVGVLTDGKVVPVGRLGVADELWHIVHRHRVMSEGDVRLGVRLFVWPHTDSAGAVIVGDHDEIPDFDCRPVGVLVSGIDPESVAVAGKVMCPASRSHG